MSPFPKFTEKYGAGDNKRDISPEAITRYSAILPTNLIEFWNQFGLCTYINGLIVMLNPDDYQDEKEMWVDTDTQAIIFARDAFGNLFVYAKGGVDIIFVQYGRRMRAAETVELFFEFNLLYKSFLESSLDGKFYKSAIKKTGKPGYDECLGFVPALALGGPGTLDTVKLVKVKEHLSSLRQLVP